MITQLTGTLVEKSFERVVLDVGGVGYGVLVSLHTLAALPDAGQRLTLKTVLQVREDAHVLYGFATDDERRTFELCTSVSGIGPKLALSLLSTLRPESLAEAIRTEDVARLARTPGVGKRTAERLVVELKDRIDKLGLHASARAPAVATANGGRGLQGVAATVAAALVNLGYRNDTAERAARDAAIGRESEPLEVVLREALRALSA